MKLKSFFALAICLFLLLVALTSCFSNGSGDETKSHETGDLTESGKSGETDQDSDRPETGEKTSESTSEPVYAAKMSYAFDTHAENNIRGCIAGKIRIDQIPDDVRSKYLLLYYANDNKIIGSFDELSGVVYQKNGTAEFVIGDGVFLPEVVTRVVAIPSNARFPDQTPSVKDAIASYTFPEEKRLFHDTNPELSFGAVSDVHMNYENYDRGACAKWARALRFYKDTGMNMVVIGGDLTGDEDLQTEYAKYNEIIDDSGFDFDLIYECIGNHGNTKTGRQLFVDNVFQGDEIVPHEGAAYYHIVKGNNVFIFMAQEISAPGDSAAYDNFSKEQIDWLEGLLEEYGDSGKNIFIVEHSPFLEFGPGDRYPRGYTASVSFKPSFTNTMRLKKLLASHRDVIFMSGHTHLTLYDYENYSSLGSSFARMLHLPSSCQPCGYGEGSTYTKSFDGRKNVTPQYGSETYICNVYRDVIIFIGYNLSTDKVIPGASYIMKTHLDYTDITPLEDETPVEHSLKGSGTEADPYLIESAEDFNYLTSSFNDSTDASHKYGEGLYFLQTSDIDMSKYPGYEGTYANGNSKCYFAGFYDGGGHEIHVEIDGSDQKSIFPYTYGTIRNLFVTGKIKAVNSAQPFRTNYGIILNVIIDMELDSAKSHGICYSNYGGIENTVTVTKLYGASVFPVSSNASNDKLIRVYYSSNAKGSLGKEITDPETVVNELNEYAEAHAMTPFVIKDGNIRFEKT